MMTNKIYHYILLILILNNKSLNCHLPVNANEFISNQINCFLAKSPIEQAEKLAQYTVLITSVSNDKHENFLIAEYLLFFGYHQKVKNHNLRLLKSNYKRAYLQHIGIYTT